MEERLSGKDLTQGAVWKKLLIFFLPIAAGTCIQQLYNAVDGLIVGRDADVILQDYKPFRIFACADLEARLRRCLAFEEKKPRRERLSEKEILRNIRRIDKNRARTREVLTGKTHGDASAFDLTVNTAGWEIKRLTDAVADFALRWFEG